MSNLFHRHSSPDPDTEPGCAHMLEMLNGMADGTATGIIRWYAERHVAGCPECAAALIGLQRLRVRLQAMHPAQDVDETVTPTLHILTIERQVRLQAAWDAVDGAESTP